MQIRQVWYAATSHFLSALISFLALGIMARLIDSQQLGIYILTVSLATLFADLIDFGSGLKMIIESRNLTSVENRLALKQNLASKLSLLFLLLPIVIIYTAITRKYLVLFCGALVILYFIRNNCLTHFRALDQIQSFRQVILLERIMFLVILAFVPSSIETFLSIQIITLVFSIFYAQTKGVNVLTVPSNPQSVISNFKSSFQLGLSSALSNVSIIFPILIGTLFGYRILAEYSLLMKTLLPIHIMGNSIGMFRVKYKSFSFVKYSKQQTIWGISFLLFGFFILGLVFFLPNVILFCTDSRYNFSHFQVGIAILIVLSQQMLTYMTAGLQARHRFNFINIMLLFFILSYAISLKVFSSLQTINTVLFVEVCLTVVLTMAYIRYSRRWSDAKPIPN